MWYLYMCPYGTPTRIYTGITQYPSKRRAQHRSNPRRQPLWGMFLLATYDTYRQARQAEIKAKHQSQAKKWDAIDHRSAHMQSLENTLL